MIVRCLQFSGPKDYYCPNSDGEGEGWDDEEGEGFGDLNRGEFDESSSRLDLSFVSLWHLTFDPAPVP